MGAAGLPQPLSPRDEGIQVPSPIAIPVRGISVYIISRTRSDLSATSKSLIARPCETGSGPCRTAA